MLNLLSFVTIGYMIFGHTRIQQFFAQVIKSQEFHHAYAFIGPSEIGKKSLAQDLAAKILGLALKDLPRCPDFSCFGRSVDEKTQKLKKDITVAQAREIKEKILNRPWLGGKKIVIIDDAERMNEEASNALLKALEEPAKDTIIFLIIADENMVLPTVLSRCQNFHFSVVPEKVIEEALVSRETEQKLVEELAKNCAGRIGRALNWLESPEEYDEFLSQSKEWEHMSGRTLAERFKAIEKLVSDKSDLVDMRDNLVGVMEVWMTAERAKYMNEINNNQTYNSLKHINIIDALMKGQKLLGMNVQPRLILENILLTV